MKPFLAWCAGALLVAAATGAAAVLDGAMSVAGLAMLYLVAVAAAATLLPRAPAVFASLLAVSALNFFFVPPRRSFDIDGAEYWWTLAVLLGLSLGLNVLVASLRQRRLQAEAERERSVQLHALSEALAGQRDADAMAQAAADWLHRTLGHPCAVFVQEGLPTLRRWEAPAGAPFHERSVQWALKHGRPLGRGCTDWPELDLWCAPFTRHEASGAVQLLLPGPGRVTDETAQHWLALAQQACLAIERERATSTARVAQESARAEAARNTLLASLSHDLRTPLAALVGSASTLRAQGEDLPAAQRERLLANIEHEARDLGLMADNVLQLARLSQPQWQPRRQWESVEDILGAAVTRMRRRWDHARIQLRVPAGLPPIEAEAGLLAQAVANLVDNAVRHGGEQAEVILQAGRSREGVFIAVRDHGLGLAPDEVDRLFDRWQQGQARDRGGAGLGLAICRLVAEAHGGRIAARNCDPGAEFRIDLPAAALPETGA